MVKAIDNRKNQSILTKIMVLGVLLTVLFGFMSPVFASNNSATAAELNYSTFVSSKFTADTYERKGGGVYKGNELWKDGKGGSGGTAKIVDANKFNDLTRSAQNRFADKLANLVEETQNPVSPDYKFEDATGAPTGIGKDTITNWLSSFTGDSRLGSAFASRMSKYIQPDFAGASNLLRPFQGPLGIIIGFFAGLTMMLIGVSIVLDMAYIGIPMFRNLADDGGAGSTGKKKFRPSSLISADARVAVKGGESGEKTSGSAMFSYIKTRIWFFLAFALAFIYLVSGNILSLVGMLIDAFSNITGI